MIKIKQKGNFKKIEKFLDKIPDLTYNDVLEKYAKRGVDVLSSVTPIDTGKTASSWEYEIKRTKNTIRIYWKNSNVNKNGFPIVISLQYGHGTKNGGYIQGRDFINPAIRPIFDSMADEIWKEVTSI